MDYKVTQVTRTSQTITDDVRAGAITARFPSSDFPMTPVPCAPF